MAEPNNAQTDEVAFITGVGSDGKTIQKNFWTWNRDTPPNYTGTDSAHKWQGGAAGTSGGLVTYDFNANSNWTAAEKDGWRSAMALWSAVANIQFAPAADEASANIKIARGSDGSATTFDSYRTVTAGSSTLGAINSETVLVDTSSFGAPNDFATHGGLGVATAVHELGHALGLGHGGPYNVGGPTAQPFGSYDSKLWTTMSYIPATTGAKPQASTNAPPVPDTDWGNIEKPFTWMPLDILAIQRLYGLPTSTPLSGEPLGPGLPGPGQVFGFNCNISGPLKQYYDFTLDKTPVVTLWDSGTGNTLDLSGFSTPSTIDLNPGAFSSCAGLKNNVAIAYNTKIDRAVGGPGDDTFVLNSNGDRVDGGAGTNTVVFNGPSTRYAITKFANDTILTSDAPLPEGNNSAFLAGIKFLKFTDRTIDTGTFPTTLFPAAGNAQNGSNAMAISDILQNTNLDPSLDWQNANNVTSNGMLAASVASDETAIQNASLTIALGGANIDGNITSVVAAAGELHL